MEPNISKKINAISIRKFCLISLGWSFCILFFPSCNNRKSNTSDEEKLRQQVKKYHVSKITEMVTFFHVGTPEKERINHIDFFDKNGLKTKSQVFGDDGTIEMNIENQFDENGNLINSLGTKAEGNILFRETRSYDQNGNRIELHFFLPDGTYKYRNVASYDSEGNINELNWYYTTGFKARNKYVFQNGYMVEDSEFGPDSTRYYVWKYKYDKHGNKSEAAQFSSDSIVNIKISYEYNVDNLLVRQTEYFGTAIQTSYTFEYDKKNFLSVKTKYSASGNELVRYNYLYEFY